MSDPDKTINRRDFGRAAALAGAGLALGNDARAGDRPNVLFIIVDQWRQPRWFPDPLGLPGFERLTREGLHFTNHFTSCVPCSPSRATILTGLHMPQHGIHENVGVGGSSPTLAPNLTTVGHLFQNAGYRTPYFGKWHLGRHYDYPWNNLHPYGFENWHGPDHHGLPYDGLIHDGIFTHQADAWLRRYAREKPFCLTLSLINPHDIMFYKRLDVSPVLVPNVCAELPANFHDDLAAKPRCQQLWSKNMGAILGVGPKSREARWRQYIDFYYFLHRRVDRHVSRILATLDELGLAEDTMVVFTSDHGEMAGSHQLQGKGPFVYQENNQVPLIVRWPGRAPAGTETAALASTVDFLPTIADLAGLAGALEGLPGRSLAPVIADPAASVNDHVLMAWGYSSHSSLVRNVQKLTRETRSAPGQVRAIHDGRCKFARYFDPGMEEEYELYDLKNDPYELENLAARSGNEALRKEMADRLREAEKQEMGKI